MEQISVIHVLRLLTMCLACIKKDFTTLFYCKQIRAVGKLDEIEKLAYFIYNRAIITDENHILRQIFLLISAEHLLKRNRKN
jgi:hypothetical protein